MSRSPGNATDPRPVELTILMPCLNEAETLARRIEHVCPGDKPADLKRRGIEYVLVRTDSFETWFRCLPDDWVRRMDAQVAQKIPLRPFATHPATDWYLVKLNP